MKRSLEELESIVRNRVCSVCTERTISGACGLGGDENCALFRLFPNVAEAVLATDSEDIRDYIQAVRDRVCSVCREQAADRSCDVRSQVRCALDAYLMLIVDAIEEATGKTFSRAGLDLPAAGPTTSGGAALKEERKGPKCICSLM